MKGERERFCQIVRKPDVKWALCQVSSFSLHSPIRLPTDNRHPLTIHTLSKNGSQDSLFVHKSNYILILSLSPKRMGTRNGTHLSFPLGNAIRSSGDVGLTTLRVCPHFIKDVLFLEVPTYICSGRARKKRKAHEYSVQPSRNLEGHFNVSWSGNPEGHFNVIWTGILENVQHLLG